ncbi:MAG: hypothetical protein HY699_03180 [Deltaproteobacteria bacterium]|nr:hypothetical protein [Deltaproteobacteria bacterium]
MAHTAREHLDLNLRTPPPPILIRDPFLEFLGLVAPAEPVAVTFEDLVKAAGHLCPTVAGAYLLMRHGLLALYGEQPAVRGDVRVTAYGGPTDFGYGPISQLVNLVIGAAPETGFGGLGPGRFRRRGLFVFRPDDLRHNEFELERLDRGEAVHVTYEPTVVPAPKDLGAVMGPALTTGEAAAVERFRGLWLGRVAEILEADARAVKITRK